MQRWKVFWSVWLSLSLKASIQNLPRNHSLSQCATHLDTHTRFWELWTCLVYCVGWRHAPWLLYWPLCWNVAAARFVTWQPVGQGCDYETFSSVLGGEKLMRPWYSPDDSCLYHAVPGTARLWRPHNETQEATQWDTGGQHVCCQNSHLLPPLGRSLTGCFLGWLARSLQWARSGHKLLGSFAEPGEWYNCTLRVKLKLSQAGYYPTCNPRQGK